MKKKKRKKILKKIWYFIWYEDSALSWIVNIILAFVLVKFLIYPGLGFMLSTSHPVVAVVSSSMDHYGMDFNNWWDANADEYDNFVINKENFEHYKFKNGFNKGDIMILVGTQKINKGDVIVFKGTAKEPIIHRVVKVGDSVYQTKGDANPTSRPDEKAIGQERIIGKAIFRVPLLGWIKIGFVEFINLFR